MEKKPSVFVNKIDKKLNNNEKIYFSDKEKEYKKTVKENKNDIKTVQEQIKEIFNSHTYIYKADVEIITKNNKLNKRLIGRNNTHLITMDNELIPIEDIVEIKNKNE